VTVSAQLTSDALPRRKRKVWPWVLGGFVVLIAVALVAVDALARGFAEDLIATQAADVLDVPPGSSVDVRIGGGSVLLQAVSGGLEHVEVRVGDYPVGPLVGDLTLTAEGVPFDMAQPTETITVRYDVPEEALAAISGSLSGVPIDSVTLEAPEVVANGSLSLLGLTLPLGLGLTPAAVDGALAFSPTSARIGDATIEASALASDPIWGGLAGTVLRQQTVCIADQLPAALTMTTVEVQGDVLRIEFDGSGQALDGGGFTTRGTCPA
jgi:hypothetical protein